MKAIFTQLRRDSYKGRGQTERCDVSTDKSRIRNSYHSVLHREHAIFFMKLLTKPCS